MPPEKLLSPDITGSNIKGDASDMVISIPLDGAVVPHQQIQCSTQQQQQQQHSLNGNINSQEEIVNQSSSYITTSVQNQVTTVTSTISSPKYVFIRQTSDGNFTTSSSPYITTGDGESAGVGDIILVESMEVSNADQNFVVSTNCSDEDLTSLTWLHEKDLLKSLVQCPQTDKSSYASPIQLTNSGPISPTSDFLEESCVSEDNVSSANSSSDQGISMHRPDHSPKTIESSSGNADDSPKSQKGVTHQTVSFVYNRLQFGDNGNSNNTNSSGSQANNVNGNSSSTGIDYSDKVNDAEIKSNDNNNNTINNNDSNNVSNSKDSDSKNQTVSSLADKPNIIPNTIRISSLTYPNLSVNDKITGAVNTKKIETKIICNDVIGDQIIYEKADVQASTAQETTIIPDTCIVSTVQQQRNQRTPQKIISTILQQQNTNGSETAAKPTNILPNVSQAATTNQTSPQALSAFQHFHKKYLREQMKSVEQKGCAFNGTSRSSTNNVNAIFVTTTATANSNNNNSNNNNNNNNSNTNTNNNENSNNSTCFYYSDNYSNDSYGTGNTCNVSNNDTNNNYSYPYVISNNNNNNNGSLSSSNSHTDSNNNQHIYLGNDNNNNVSCRNRNSNEVTNGSVASLAYTQQRVPPDPPEGDRIHQLTPVKISSPIQLNCSNRLNPSKDIPHYDALSPTKGGTVINRNSTASHPTPKPAGSPKQKHPNNLPYDPMVHTTNKPPYSFSLLIFMAIEDSPDKALPVKEIYSWIVQHFPYFKNAPNGWKNSVRHNLSLNKSFQKVEKAPNMGKGSLWRVEEQHRPNLLQALTRSPFFPTSAIDKSFPYRNSPMPRTDDSNQPATPTKSNLDARLFPKLSKMIKEIVTKGSYSDSVEIDDDENHQHIAGNSAFIDNSVDIINENSSIVGDIYHQSNGSNIFNNNNVNSVSNIIESTSNNNDNHNDSCNNSSNNYNNIDNHISYSSYTDSNSNNCIISNKITNCKSNNGDCSSPNSAIDNSSLISSSYNSITRLARDCGADTMDDVNAATAMLALKHGPKIFTERFQNGSPVITSSPSEDHTYSAGGGNASTGSHSQNGSDINSNGASSDAAYESSEESHIYAISAEELEEQRRHAEGVDALLSFAMSSPSGSSLKRFAPTDDDYTEQTTFIETIGNARTEIDGPVTFKVHDGTIMSPYPSHHVEVQNYYQYSTEPSPSKKFKSSHKLRTKLKRKVQWVR